MENELVLKNNLKEARAKKQISQRELAEMVGVSRNTISSIETMRSELCSARFLFCKTDSLSIIIPPILPSLLVDLIISYQVYLSRKSAYLGFHFKIFRNLLN